MQAAFGILRMMATSVKNIHSRITMSLSMYLGLPDNEHHDSHIITQGNNESTLESTREAQQIGFVNSNAFDIKIFLAYF